MGFAAGVSIFLMVLRAAIVGLPLLPSVASDTDLPKGVMDFWQAAAKNQSFTASFAWPITDNEYEHMASQFDFSSIAPGFDTSRFRAVLNRISALPSDIALPRELDAELAELHGTLALKRGHDFTWWPTERWRYGANGMIFTNPVGKT